MNARHLITGLFLSWAISATAQLSGTFYLDKSTFAPGVPIFLHFKVSNRGNREGLIDQTGLPEKPGCAGYQIEISRNPPIASSCQKLLFNSPLEGCNWDGPISVQPIKPGKSFTDRILLNLAPQVNDPGEYSTHAKYFNEIGGAESHLETEATLHLRVDRSAPAPTRAFFLPWVDQLHSRNHRKRAEAAEVLANLAPRSLERLLLGWVKDPDLRWYAPLALHRLNTPRSIAALATLLREPPSSERSEAASYLAETADQRWLPVLFDAAKQNPDDSRIYLVPAAELGGDKAIPTLVAIQKGSNRFLALNAAMAMGSTGSRTAIPYLLEYLKSSEDGIAESANGSLERLTHRRATAQQKAAMPADYPKWSQWWSRDGATAPVYKAADAFCGPFQPLP